MRPPTAATAAAGVAMALLPLALASPPACLIGALQKQSNPANTALLCGALQPAMAGNLTQVCAGPSLAAAYDAYSAVCRAQGVAVPELAAPPSGSAAESGAQRTGTGAATGTAGASSPTRTGAGAGPAESESGTGKNGAGVQGAHTSVVFAVSGLLGTLFAGVVFL